MIPCMYVHSCPHRRKLVWERKIGRKPSMAPASILPWLHNVILTIFWGTYWNNHPSFQLRIHRTTAPLLPGKERTPRCSRPELWGSQAATATAWALLKRQPQGALPAADHRKIQIIYLFAVLAFESLPLRAIIITNAGRCVQHHMYGDKEIYKYISLLFLPHFPQYPAYRSLFKI